MSHGHRHTDVCLHDIWTMAIEAVRGNYIKHLDHIKYEQNATDNRTLWNANQQYIKKTTILQNLLQSACQKRP